jgi:hypothetical protein
MGKTFRLCEQHRIHMSTKVNEFTNAMPWDRIQSSINMIPLRLRHILLDLQGLIRLTVRPTDKTHVGIEEETVSSPWEWSGPSVQIRIFWELSDDAPVSE